jgi:selenide,water dikinase
VPLLSGALELAAGGVLPGGSKRNAGYVAGVVDVASDVPAALSALLADAQTSGGLLLAVPAERSKSLVGALVDAGHRAAEIGELSDGAGAPTIRVLA